MAKINDIPKWREDIQISEKFREEQFGNLEDKTKAGENIDYYEKGFSDNISNNLDMLTTVNIVDALVSIVVPSLYFKNPKTIATPRKISSESTAPLASRILDYYRERMQAEEINQKIIWDAYVLGMGVYKIGYATKFGTDIPDEKKKKTIRDRVDEGLELVGLKKKKEEEVIRPEMDIRIVAENPFIQYVSPFDFLIDPRATSINDATWMGHRVRKTVKEMKSNKKYKNTSDLRGNEPDVRTLDFTNISLVEQEDFKTVDLYEIHYRNNDEMYFLVISKDADGEMSEHYHDNSIYKLGEWQFDVLMFKNHGHSLYPRSDISKMKILQDRITSTVDAILEQVDKFVPKIAYQKDDVTEGGQFALKNGGIGALVETTKNPNEVFKELNFTQLKSDLKSLLEQVISLISIQTGITGAQLTGVSRSGSATEATIEQGGQSIRISDMQSKVRRFVNRQSGKLLKIVTQFVELEDLELINGVRGVDEQGLPKYNWLSIDFQTSEKLQEGQYDFDIEVGSTEKTNLSLVRKSFENLVNILARPDVIQIMASQGQTIRISELVKPYIGLFPEIGVDASKIIEEVQQQPMQQGPGGQNSGSANNALEKQLGEDAPTFPNVLSPAGQV